MQPQIENYKNPRTNGKWFSNWISLSAADVFRSLVHRIWLTVAKHTQILLKIERKKGAATEKQFHIFNNNNKLKIIKIAVYY